MLVEEKDSISLPKEYYEMLESFTNFVMTVEKGYHSHNLQKEAIVPCYESLANLCDWMEDRYYRSEENKRVSLRTSLLVRHLSKIKFGAEEEEGAGDVHTQVKSVQKLLQTYNRQSPAPAPLRRKYIQPLNLRIVTKHNLGSQLELLPLTSLQSSSIHRIFWLKGYSALGGSNHSELLGQILPLLPSQPTPIDFSQCQKNTRLAFLAVPPDQNRLPYVWTASQPQLGDVQMNGKNELVSTLRLELSSEYLKLANDLSNRSNQERFLRFFSTKGSKKAKLSCSRKNFLIDLYHHLSPFLGDKNKQNQSGPKKRKLEDEDVKRKRQKVDDDFLLKHGLD
jgi:hypothetical protein